MPPALAAWLILVLALLNPLACLIHCAAMDQRLHHGYAQNGSGSFFVCDLHQPATQYLHPTSTSDLQIPQQTRLAIPRAVYEGMTVSMILIASLTLLCRAMPCCPPRMVGSRIAPLTPPPRLALIVCR